MKVYRLSSNSRAYFLSQVYDTKDHFIIPTKDGIEYESFPKDTYKLDVVDVKDLGKLSVGFDKK